MGGLTIKAYGFNYSAHYKFDSEPRIHAFADKLTPKRYWGSLLVEDVAGDNRKGGLFSLQMYQPKEDGEGQITILLQRSAPVKTAIYLSCNDHVNINDDDSSAEVAMEKIENTFDASFVNMAKLQNDLIEETMKDE